MDRIPVVDESDNIIRYKEDDDRNLEDIYRVSALWLTNQKGEILLAQRAHTKWHDPGKWGPAVAGTVEEGETYKENIIKETEEELGVSDIQFQEGPKERVKGKHNYFCQWYLATYEKAVEGFKINKDEVEQVAWFSPEELAQKINETPGNFLSNMGRWVELFG